MEHWQDPEWVKQMTVRIDFSRMMSESVGSERGITRTEINDLAPRTAAIAADIEKRRRHNEIGFYNLPYDVETAGDLVQMATALRKNCDDFIVMGIGGSSLGAVALFRSLCHPLHNVLPRRKRGSIPRIFFMDNIDPATCKTVFGNLNPEKTVFNVVTKSGTTTETVSQFLAARDLVIERLGKAAVKKHFVITTDNKPNPLRKIAEKEGYPILDIPENVGGRFSVFSAVGLFPAAVLGIDIEELLAGAWYMEQRCRQADIWQNPAYLLGALHYLADTRKGLNIAVMMPYSDALNQLAFWFRQLWAESLGKAVDMSGKVINCGQTPVAASGATDQHSQLQLYMEGPYNKMITFLHVADHNARMELPRGVEKEYRHLAGHEMGELLNIEASSTQIALTKAGRSSMSIILPVVNAFTVGQLLFLFEVQTLFAGGLYNINPLVQPGVQASKDYIYGMLGREGFESQAKEIADWQQRENPYIV